MSETILDKACRDFLDRSHRIGASHHAPERRGSGNHRRGEHGGGRGSRPPQRGALSGRYAAATAHPARRCQDVDQSCLFHSETERPQGRRRAGRVGYGAVQILSSHPISVSSVPLCEIGNQHHIGSRSTRSWLVGVGAEIALPASLIVEEGSFSFGEGNHVRYCRVIATFSPKTSASYDAYLTGAVRPCGVSLYEKKAGDSAEAVSLEKRKPVIAPFDETSEFCR